MLKDNGRYNSGVSFSDGILSEWSQWKNADDCGITTRDRSRTCDKNPDSPNDPDCDAVCVPAGPLYQQEDDIDAGCCEGKVQLIKTMLRPVMALCFTIQTHWFLISIQ